MILELTQAVDRVAQAIDPNELAFLAMTSKLEFPFRDRLAYALALAMPNDERIAREWNRCDLAWLSGSAPRLLVELKACYSFDLVSQPEIYFGHLRRDLLKARILAGPGPACFAVLMATHLSGPVPAALYDTVKYARGINSAIAKLGTAEHVRTRAIEEVERRLSGFCEAKAFQLKFGSYLGISVEVLGWIVGESSTQESA